MAGSGFCLRPNSIWNFLIATTRGGRHVEFYEVRLLIFALHTERVNRLRQHLRSSRKLVQKNIAMYNLAFPSLVLASFRC